MRKTALVFALASSLPACTMLGVVAGRTLATSNNDARQVAIARGQPPPAELSVTRTILACAVVGFLLDGIMVYAAVQSLEHINIPVP